LFKDKKALDSSVTPHRQCPNFPTKWHLWTMRKKECPSCAMNVDAAEKVCPICRYEFPATATGWKWLAAFLLVVFIYLIASRLF
jgi:RNA polymerase subunit RPABC4/transcription elongation factor Spt4